jgi:hypothetical protein
MPSWKSRHFKVETRVGASSAAAVTLRKGSSEQHEVIVTPVSGIPKRTQVFCIRSSGTAAGYNPAPPDAWDHDFGKIDCSSPPNSRTASHAVQASQASGTVILQVRELQDDDGLPSPSPRVHSISPPLNVNVNVA